MRDHRTGARRHARSRRLSRAGATPTCRTIDDHRSSTRPIRIVNAIGAKGIGEIGITGAAAAIANAVYHATGKRVRDLPITPDKLLYPSPPRLREG